MDFASSVLRCNTHPDTACDPNDSRDPAPGRYAALSWMRAVETLFSASEEGPSGSAGGLRTLLLMLLLTILLAAAGTVPASGQAITGTQPESGAPGTTVEIYGTGFSTTASDNTVEFGSKTATVDSAKSTVIYAKVPSGPKGPVDVSVTVNGTSAAGSVKFGIVTGGGVLAEVSIDLSGAVSGATSLEDVDGDGDQDLLIAGQNSSGDPATTLYKQQSDGSFQAAGVGLTGLQTAATSVEDVDGDGDQDLLVAGEDIGGNPTTA